MKILIAVIAFNEELNIRKTILDLQKSNSLNYDIVVIDNGSSDNTVEECKKEGIPVLSHCINSGGSGGTVTTYFMYAFQNNYDILCQFDGDGQHLSSELNRIINPIIKGEANLIIGSRFIEKKGFQSSFLRRIGIRLFNVLDSLFTGQKLTDVTSGFRAYDKKTISFFSKYYKHEIHDPNQLILLSHFANCKISEVPVVMKEREFGSSEFNPTGAISFILKGLVNIFGCVLQKKQIQAYSKRENNGS